MAVISPTSTNNPAFRLKARFDAPWGALGVRRNHDGESMRSKLVAAVAIPLLLGLPGCGQPGASFQGPTVPAFNGRLVSGGNPVAFPEGEDVFVKVFHERGQSFNIPIKSDGTFKIGWMPIGKYSAALMRKQKAGKGGPGRYGMPDFSVVEGQTDYVLELGKGFKP
jgi:hypothetical protein